jgi:hypothetical protein
LPLPVVVTCSVPKASLPAGRMSIQQLGLKVEVGVTATSPSGESTASVPPSVMATVELGRFTAVVAVGTSAARLPMSKLSA